MILGSSCAPPGSWVLYVCLQLSALLNLLEFHISARHIREVKGEFSTLLSIQSVGIICEGILRMRWVQQACR